ncbi:MAG: DUF6318 family protein [Nocardioidaceae bacterium]
MRRTLAVWLTAGVCALGVVAGCGGDDTADPDPTPSTTADPSTSLPATSPSTTSSPTTTTTSHTAASPTMPGAANHKTKAGAKAFVHHYIKTLNYAWAHEHGAPLRPLAAKSCSACRALSRAIDEVSRKGGYQHGAQWRGRSLIYIATEPLNAPIINAAIWVRAGAWKRSSSDEVHHVKPHWVHHDFHLKWTRSGWLVKKLIAQ